MFLPDRKALLAYFNARSLPGLERQFNSDGRLAAVLLDTADDELLVATAEVLTVLTFPIHVSDLLGTIERDRIAAERLAGL